MKDTRFTELLNLYLDHRLSAFDAAELEAEVMRNPERRRTYAGYCRMQRACNLIFDNECEKAPQSFALARALSEVERKLAAPAHSQSRRSVVWLGWSGAAAAACVVVVSVTVAMRELPVEQGTEIAPAVVVVKQPVSSVAQARMSPAVAAIDPGAVAAAPVVIASAMQSPTGVPSSVNASPDSNALEWSRVAAQRWIDAEAAALVTNRLVDDGRFEVTNTTRSTGGIPSFRSAQTGGWRGELTSYQFQR